MDIKAWLVTSLEGTSVCSRSIALLGLYERADLDVSAWAETSGTSCPPGCGICCERFVPDLTTAEAELVASYLLSEHPGLMDRTIFSPVGMCPFYFADSPFHCGIYPVRPLVCRLFGFAGTRDKNGAVAFSRCRFMPSACSIEGNATRPAHAPSQPQPVSVQPPLMSRYGDEVPSDNGRERLPIAEAVRLALMNVSLIAGLRSRAEKGDDPDRPSSGTETKRTA